MTLGVCVCVCMCVCVCVFMCVCTSLTSRPSRGNAVWPVIQDAALRHHLALSLPEGQPHRYTSLRCV